MQIAVYGKGGIGKSTMSANLSAALAVCGSKVLQIGCDPKHDSTRLLHHGRKVATILDYLLNTPEDDQKLDDVLMKGYLNVGCVEAGGPRPGMGCAGRGILTAFDFLNQFHAMENYDQIVYDVLGDVVCGGFAVPVRKQYANAVFLVTSGESMAIYAANNILCGIRNLNPHEKQIAGIIYNSRGVGDESKRVEDFAQAVHLPILARIPRSDLFAQAEKEALTLVEKDPQSVEAQIFIELAKKLLEHPAFYTAEPLSEEQMELFMRGSTFSRPLPSVPATKEATIIIPKVPAAPSGTKKRALSDPFSRVPLFGCAYRGAVDLAIHIKDAAVLGHAPKSCTWYAINGFSSYARRGLYERGILYPAFVPRQFENTDITINDAVYGGVEHARQKALEMAARGIRNIIVVTACIPGLSGDDLIPLQKELKSLGVNMYIIHADGIEAGDYNDGMALCYKTLAQEAVDPNVEPEPDCINIVYEPTISSQTDTNFIVIKELLGKMGLRINCRFLCAESMENIHQFKKAPYSIMARYDELGNQLQKIFEEKYEIRFLDGELPKGFSETADWLRTIGKLYGKTREAEQVIEEKQLQYRQKIEALKPLYEGKKVIFFLNNKNIDWIFELSRDLGWDVAETILIGSKEDRTADWRHQFSKDWDSNLAKLKKAVSEKNPDLVLLNHPLGQACIPDHIFTANLTRDVNTGFFAGTDCALRWSQLLENSLEGRWKHDKSIFEKRCL
ncbi:nitrogenase component 1 [Blautia sp.]